MAQESCYATAEGLSSAKEERIRNLDIQKCIEASYTSNNQKEQEFLSIASQYEIKLHKRFTNRRLFLTAKNEFGVPKCVCSTIKPHLLPYPAVHEAQPCSQWLAHYMTFEPLEKDLNSSPSFLPSPTQVFKWGVGDSFDLSTLLVSFLIGSGYDAYVVYGIATEKIYRRDLTKFSYIYDDEAEKADIERILESMNCIPSLTDHDTIQAQNFPSDIDYESGATPSSSKQTQPIEEGRIHCWVLIKEGMKSPNDTYFIEPSTGKRFDPNEPNSPYIQVFALWNTSNYWVNTSTNGDIDQVNDVHTSDVWKPVFQRNKSCDSHEGDLSMNVMETINSEPPSTWVRKLNLSSDDFTFSYPPKGNRVDIYDKVKVELFSAGCQKQSNFQKRLTTYESCNRDHVLHHVEYFYDRRDCLTRRIRLPFNMSFHETFSLWQHHSMEERMEVPGRKRILKFRYQGRSDGLTCRNETIHEKIDDSFVGRHDGLVRRTIYFEEVNDADVNQAHQIKLPSIDGNQNVVVVKVLEQYERLKKTDPFSQDTRRMATRDFHFQSQRKIETTFYNEEGKIANHKIVVQGDHSHEDTPGMGTEHEQHLTEVVRSTLAELRRLQEEMIEIISIRRNEEFVHNL